MPKDKQTNMITIGSLSRQTGIPINTIRTWERRYGFPSAVRTPSGHRLYTHECSQHLQLISIAVQHGYRASLLVKMTRDEIRDLLSPSGVSSLVNSRHLDRWLNAARCLDENTIRDMLNRFESQHGLMTFCSDIAPLLICHIEQAWLRKDIQIHHEHFVSENVRDFLSRKWREIAKTNTGPTVLATTLPNDKHNLGLILGVTIMVGIGYKITMLGDDTPIHSIVQAVSQQHPEVLLLSYSLHKHEASLLSDLQQIREKIPDEIKIFVGGPPNSIQVPNLETFNSFSGFKSFVERIYADTVG